MEEYYQKGYEFLSMFFPEKKTKIYEALLYETFEEIFKPYLKNYICFGKNEYYKREKVMEDIISRLIPEFLSDADNLHDTIYEKFYVFQKWRRVFFINFIKKELNFLNKDVAGIIIDYLKK